jgi:hypothetical protein
MYLIIFEDMVIQKTKTINEEYKANCIDGVIDIINITNPFKPTQFRDGQWFDILSEEE